MSIAYINGEYYNLEDAKVSTFDRGFLFGDGVYEVIYIKNGGIYQFDEHLDRYFDSAKGLMLESYPGYDELKELSEELMNKSDINEGLIYFQVTRGTAPRQHDFPKNADPTIFAYIIPTYVEPEEEERRRTKGVKTILVPDERWDRCYIKTINLIPNCIYKEKAKQEGAFEAIQVHETAGVTEGTSTSIFGIKDGILYTAPEGKRVLPGVTRKTVLMLAREVGIPYDEVFLTKEELLNCDEVFLSSTSCRVMPINQIDMMSFEVSKYEITFILQEKLDEYIEKNTKR